MRTSKTFEIIHIVSKAEALSPHSSRHVITGPPTGWKSPVPYLFGGLAAMLGLIAFALLILACSYWKLSGHMNSGENSDENSDENSGDVKAKEAAVFMNSVFVIMAGEEKPTFLATPATSRTTSFGVSDGETCCPCICSCSSSSSSLSSSSVRSVGGDVGDTSEVQLTSITTVTENS